MAEVTLIKRTNPPCPACQTMQAQLEGEGVPHDTIDVTEQPEVIEEYGLQSVPVTIVNGEQLNGFQPVEKVRELMK